MKEKPWTLQGFYDLVYYELVNKEYTELKKKASTFIIIVEFIKKRYLKKDLQRLLSALCICGRCQRLYTLEGGKAKQP